ncbi:MAG TPA: XrtA/PEP-CTERM system histidine kinase PrsK [Methylomirabilota bacterium]|nr:XrtA/PEP-CTERM system histidine kinase PrsK [Methylomirabilota bacterium]
MIAILILVTGLASLVVAGAALLRPPRRLPQLAFAAGMAALGLEALLIYGLLFQSSDPTSHVLWLLARGWLAVLLPIPWCLFVFLSGRHPSAPVPMSWRIAFFIGSAGLMATALLSLTSPFFRVPLVQGGFRYAELTGLGRIGAAVEVLATIAVLYGLEPSLRNSRGSVRWKLKYLALGVGGVFVLRFYLLSQILLFSLLTPDSLVISTIALAIGLVFIAVGLVRTGGFRTDLAVSRHFVYRSIIVGVSGAYLMLAGTSGWLLNTLGIPGAAIWGTLVLFVAVMGLSVLLLSEDLRWRIKRYISTHFYGEKYDYRQQWRSFTGSLATRVNLEGVVGQLLRSVTETIGATRGAIYLADEPDGLLRLGATQNTGPLPKTLELKAAAFRTGKRGPEACLVADLGNGPAQALLDAGVVVAVPLPLQGRLMGVLLVGAERTETPYAVEDLDLLTTLGEQGAYAIATAQLSERLAQSRAFEAFSRLTSFVVHDLKNSISALSLLSQNAREHFDNPEFRRDALKTLGRTVERMQKLVRRLSSRQVAEEFQLEPLELGALAQDAAESILGGSRVRLTLQLEPVPPVRADADAFQRMIQNLITNAVEAMDGEGEVKVRVFRQDEMVACAVSDTGCGMSEEFIRTSLFVPFQTTKKGGWGIGLYQAREAIAAHGGSIEVASREGHGTTVTLLFPVTTP